MWNTIVFLFLKNEKQKNKSKLQADYNKHEKIVVQGTYFFYSEWPWERQMPRLRVWNPKAFMKDTVF